jgi:hypothetical protein
VHDGKKKLQGFIDVADLVVVCMEKGTRARATLGYIVAYATLRITRVAHSYMGV